MLCDVSIFCWFQILLWLVFQCKRIPWFFNLHPTKQIMFPAVNARTIRWFFQLSFPTSWKPSQPLVCELMLGDGFWSWNHHQWFSLQKKQKQFQKQFQKRFQKRWFWTSIDVFPLFLWEQKHNGRIEWFFFNARGSNCWGATKPNTSDGPFAAWSGGWLHRVWDMLGPKN